MQKKTEKLPRPITFGEIKKQAKVKTALATIYDWQDPRQMNFSNMQSKIKILA